MTHYMELLATNQPWNLIIFMAIPVILAETVAITELYMVLTGNRWGKVGILSRFSGIVGGFYFTWIFIYLLFSVFIPLSLEWGWRWIADIIAVSAYLLWVIPLVGIALTDMGIIGNPGKNRESLHAFFVGFFLIIAHIGMIFGMLSPTVLGFKSALPASMQMDDMENMNH